MIRFPVQRDAGLDSKAVAHQSRDGPAAEPSGRVTMPLDESPRVVAQRRQLDGLFGSSAPEEARRDGSGDATGLPTRLKSGIEALSGLDMSQVRVHANSGQPAQLHALAYAQGNDIHLAPQQEHHLPHEAWHVVQQAQGRVRPTTEVAGTGVNDDPVLEREADVAGARALQVGRDAPASQMKRGAHAGSWVTQLVDFPKDSIGNTDRVMARTTGEKARDITGTDLQKHILAVVNQAGEKGGCRIGSYYLSLGSSITMTRDKALENEEHGMGPLPKSVDVGALDPFVRAFVLGTMRDALQLQYIQKNAQAIYDTHHVVVDVDCQFDRRGEVGFHKDSRGTTVFVNLTFSNEEEMQGTETYEDVIGDEGLEQKLPDEVRKDIRGRQDASRQSTSSPRIDSQRLEPHGRISFSDPNLYHSTPLMGRRLQATGDESKEEMLSFLSRLPWLPAELGIEEDELAKQPEEALRKWYGIYLNKYNWHNFEKLSANSAMAYDKTKAISRSERRLSQELAGSEKKQQDLKKESDTPRTFLRTWVRFVPK